MNGIVRIEQGNAFKTAAEMAAVLARPFRFLDSEHWVQAPLSGAEMARLAAARTFARPVEKAVSRANGLRDLSFDNEVLAHLTTTPGGRLVLRILTEPAPRLAEAGLLVAAAALSRAVLRFAHKAERRRIRDILGEAAYAVATSEAPTLYPQMALAGTDGFVASLMVESLPVEAARARVVDLGLGLLVAHVGEVEPSLLPVARLRMPASARAAEIEAVLAGFRPGQSYNTPRLLARRMPTWPAITG